MGKYNQPDEGDEIHRRLVRETDRGDQGIKLVDPGVDDLPNVLSSAFHHLINRVANSRNIPKESLGQALDHKGKK